MKTVICNWKMNPKSFDEAKRLFAATKKLSLTTKGTDIVVLPPTIFLRELAKSYRGVRIEFGAQHVFWEQEGSHTGDTSPAQVRDSGATHVLIGHAERRILGETDAQVRMKVAASLELKLDVIIAVGERERDAHGEHIQQVREQIVTALADAPPARYKNITIAYEPVWAIGAAFAPDAHEVHQMMLLVRKTIRDTYGERAFKLIRVVYGGAVNKENAEAIFAVPDLDGVLIGRASLDPTQLESIIKAAQ